MRRYRLMPGRLRPENQQRRKPSRPKNQPAPSLEKSALENRADLVGRSLIFLGFSTLPAAPHLLTRIFRTAISAPAFVPAVPDREYERGIVSGVVTSDAGVRQMSERSFGGKGAPRLHKHVCAESQPLCEIYSRCIAWRNIAGSENRAANDRNIRRIFLPTREIPLPDRWPHAGAVHSAGRRKHGIERQHIHSPFEIAA